jgi:hypothetical protein
MKTILSTALLLFTINCISQIKYEQGYFKDNGGNRTECLIRNIAWKDSPADFEYKLTESGNISKALINDVSEFSVGDTYKFIRYTVDIDFSAYDVSSLSIKKEPEWVSTTAFFKVLVEGDITLLEYVKGNTARFLSVVDGKAEQLVYKPYKAGQSIGYNNAFRGQLYELMKGKITDTERFKNLKYQKDKLVKLFLEYNGGDQEEEGNFTARQNKTKFGLKITPGMNITSGYLNQASYGFVQAGEFDTKPVFRIGLEAELVLPFNNNKWSVFIDPNYQHYKNSLTQKTDTETKEWSVDYKHIEIPVGVRHYIFLGDKSKIFLNAGYSIAIVLGKGSSRMHYEGPHSSRYTLNGEAGRGSNFMAGGGFSYDRFSAELRYNAKREIVPNSVSWYSEYSSIGLILGYKIF